jgi:hypothetical protein
MAESANGRPVTSAVRTISGYGLPILAGRAFVEADGRTGGNAVIVNHIFAEDRGGTNAVLGRHLRIVRETDIAGEVERGPWLEIIGVVRDLESFSYEPADNIYLPADRAQLTPPINLTVRVRVEPAMGFAPRLRQIAAAVDPELQLVGLVSAGERERAAHRAARWARTRDAC